VPPGAPPACRRAGRRAGRVRRAATPVRTCSIARPWPGSMRRRPAGQRVHARARRSRRGRR